MIYRGWCAGSGLVTLVFVLFVGCAETVEDSNGTAATSDTAAMVNASVTPAAPSTPDGFDATEATGDVNTINSPNNAISANAVNSAVTADATQMADSARVEGSAKTESFAQNTAQATTTQTTEVIVDPEAIRILDVLFQTYRDANAYADRGFVQVSGTYGDGEPLAMEIPMVSVLTRPNRIRLETYTTTLVSNGTEMIAFIADYPGQVMRRTAPDRLTVREFFTDPILAEALTQGAIFRGELGFTQSVTWLPPPLLLLLDEDPGRTLLDEATKVETLPPMVLKTTPDGTAESTENTEDTENSETAKATGAFCYQIKITRRDGAIVLRVDAKTHLLRQMDFPVGDYGEIRQMVIRANFEGATFVEPDSPTLFAWEIPEGIPVVERLQPPREPAAQIIGKPVPDFSFENSNAVDEPITRQMCADRPLLVTFWATDSPDSLDLLDLYGEIAQKYRDQIRILAVNVDPASIPQEAVDVKWRKPDDATAGTLIGGRDIDPDDPVAVRFQLGTIPTTFFVGTDGKIQDILVGLPLKEREQTPESQSTESTENKANEGNTANTTDTLSLTSTANTTTDGDTVVVDRAAVETRVDLLLAGNELGTLRLAEIAARQEELLRNFTQFDQRYATWLETWLADGRYRFTETLMDAFTQAETDATQNTQTNSTQNTQ